MLDVTVVWAGPHCTELLAEWGAEAIRVEPLQHIQPATRGAETRVTKEMAEAMRGTGQFYASGFPNRDPGERPWNRQPQFNSHAHDKRSMTLDIMTPEGLDVFKRLVAISDVLVENNAPDTIEKAGITYEQLAPLNPALIMLRISAYGQSGPYKYYRSFGSQVECMTGHQYLRGYPDVEPWMAGSAFVADAAAGVQGAFAVMLALRQRRLTGRGQQIELSLAENFLPYLGEVILDYTINGREAQPRGNEHRSHAPHGAYPCRGEDRWIAVDVDTDAAWLALCAVAGKPEWAADPRFATSLRRWHNRAELDQLLGEWTAGEDAFDLFHRLQAAGVTAGPVQNEADVYACPQLADRGFFQRLEQADAGTHDYPGLQFRRAGLPNRFRRPPVRLGEDNDYVYRELLAVSDEEYERLERLGHIGMDYPAYRSPSPTVGRGPG